MQDADMYYCAATEAGAGAIAQRHATPTVVTLVEFGVGSLWRG